MDLHLRFSTGGNCDMGCSKLAAVDKWNSQVAQLSNLHR